MQTISFEYALMGFRITVTIEFDPYVFGELKQPVTAEDIVDNALARIPTVLRFDKAHVYIIEGIPSLINTTIWGDGYFVVTTKMVPKK
ncbi:hypothetical protein KAZ57_02170 [Patescibacteria group bacterium]|nr:hypothetical protein [Patescibacteria group bacterium]